MVANKLAEAPLVKQGSYARAAVQAREREARQPLPPQQHQPGKQSTPPSIADDMQAVAQQVLPVLITMPQASMVAH